LRIAVSELRSACYEQDHYADPDARDLKNLLAIKRKGRPFLAFA
jgi:hypothetical protein